MGSTYRAHALLCLLELALLEHGLWIRNKAKCIVSACIELGWGALYWKRYGLRRLRTWNLLFEGFAGSRICDPFFFCC